MPEGTKPKQSRPELKSIGILLSSIVLLQVAFPLIFGYVSFQRFLILQVGVQVAIIIVCRIIGKGGQCNSIPAPGSCKGQLAVVTGANAGIGKATCINLAKCGITVVMACRNKNRGNAALEEVKKESKSDDVHLLLLDLSDFNSIRSFAADFQKKFINEQQNNLTYLVNNAGVMMCPYSKTAQGYEMQFGTNHLGHFLLTNLLMEVIEKSSSRVVNLSSVAHARAPFKIDWAKEAVKEKSEYQSLPTYSISKAANILFTMELQKRFNNNSSTKAKAYAVHPGGVNSELGRHFNPLLVTILHPMLLIAFKSMNEGCQTSLFCCFDDNAQCGRYHADCQLQPTHYDADFEQAKVLWSFSESATSK